MKICLLGSAKSVHIIRWVNALSERGYDVYLLSMQEPSTNLINNTVKFIKLKFPSPYGYYLNYYQTRKIIKQINPDLIHAHYASGYGTLSRLIKYKPTILSVWGSDIYIFPYKNLFNMMNIKKNLCNADLICSTSKDMKLKVKKLVDSEKEIVITPFGVDTKKFYPKKKTKTDTITIGTVKSMEPVYGIEYLLKSFKIISIVKPKDVQVRFLLVGGGKVDYFKNIAKKLEIDHLTEFTGYVNYDDIPSYLNKLDIFCAPSLSESFGVAALEASACEIPVIVSNVGGFPEVVVENCTGYLVPPKNEEILAERILELLLDEKKREIFGKNGREFVLSKYNWDSNVDIMETVYKSIVKVRNK